MLRFTTSSGPILDTRKSDEKPASVAQTSAQPPLEKGPAFKFFEKLEAMNKQAKKRIFRTSILSKQNPTSGERMMNALHDFGLDIDSMSLTQGKARPGLARVMSSDLFFSMNQADVIAALKEGIPAALIVPPKSVDNANTQNDELIFAFDFDGVIGDDSSEIHTQLSGLAAYHEHEAKHKDVPFPDGPLFSMFTKLHEIKTQNPDLPIRTILITSRGASTCFRPLNKIAEMCDETHFLAGAKKGPYLKELNADIFFDDNARHAQNGADHDVLSAHVIKGVANRELLAPDIKADKAADTNNTAVTNKPLANVYDLRKQSENRKRSASALNTENGVTPLSTHEQAVFAHRAQGAKK